MRLIGAYKSKGCYVYLFDGSRRSGNGLDSTCSVEKYSNLEELADYMHRTGEEPVEITDRGIEVLKELEER